ncbi:UPF0481 protein At3g47200-like isoform X2 [Argentina anserina]|nr:UPF0481 protein At3g47200-like isoform X2 [Potentilla anserina]
MKELKKKYLNEVLARMENITLKDLTGKVTEFSDQENEDACSFETQARRFYGEPLLAHISSKDFMEMMIVDGCFLVQLFRKSKHSILRSSDDPVFNMDCMFHFLCHDILLVENQLPWFVIHSLYTLTLDKFPDNASLSTLILNAFSILPSLKRSCSSYGKHLNKSPCDVDYLHILDLLRASILPLKTIDEGSNRKQSRSSNRGDQGTIGKGEESEDKSVHDGVFEPDHHQIRTATELAKADIKFQKVIEESIMDIHFEEGGWFRNGILKIPQLNVGMSSETLFRNLIAIEQCYHGYSNEITSYAIFMDNLISSKEDLELLWKYQIIGNWMSDEDGCKFFSNLYKDIPHNKFYYVKLCEHVNARHRSKWYQWLAVLKSERFANPWRILAFGIGFLILFLTAWSSANNIRVNMHKK